MRRRSLTRVPSVAIAVVAALGTLVSVAYANTTPLTLPLSQNWSDTDLITTNDDWSRVPGIIGYRGDNLAAEGADPQAVTADGSGTPVDVTANKTNPRAHNNGGVMEFHGSNQAPTKDTNPTVALQGNVTADAPHLVLNVNTTGQSRVRVSYTLRDIDDGMNDAPQPVALQYRVGGSGDYTNLPDGYVPDATTGPKQAVLNTPVSAVLPAEANNKPLVQVRILTVNTATQDEWVGIDDISVLSLNPAIDLNGSGAGSGYSATFTEDAGPKVLVDGTALTVTDADDPNLASATVKITNLQDGDAESLDADTSGTTIAKTYDPSAGELRLTDVASMEDYQKVLRTVTYDNASQNPDTTDRSVTFVVNDGTENSDTTTSTVTVNRVNDAPNAVDDTATTDEDSPVNINVKANDADLEEDSITVTGVSDASNGTATINPDDTVRYAPDANYSGEDSFEYRVCDDGRTDGADDPKCDTSTVILAVAAVNDAPVANDDSYNADEDTTLTVPAPGALENDTDADGNALTVRLVTGPSNGLLDLRPDGSFTYSANADFSGKDSFTYRACDSTGACSEPVIVTITVTAVNDTPQANDDGSAGSPAVTMNEDYPKGVVVDVLANDTGLGDRPITVTATNGTATVNPDNTVTYTPNANENGDDTLTYTVTDTDGETSTARIFARIFPVNDPPEAIDDRKPTGEDEIVTLNVLANDNDPEGELDSSSLRVVTHPQHGQTTVNADGSITYNPNANFNGTDTFTYEVCDAQGECDTATVEIPVAAANDAPIASDDLVTTDGGSPIRIDVLANDEDPEGGEGLDPSSVEVTKNPARGTTAVSPDGSITYGPEANFDGGDAFTYRVCDTGTPRLCDTARVEVTVSPVNDAPEVRDDRGSTGEAAAMRNAYISQYASPTASTPTGLYQPNTAQRPYTLIKIGADIAGPTNAIGYRSTDHSIYGYRLTSSPGIMKVNPSTGAARYLGKPRQLPASDKYNAGDVSPNGSTYYLHANKSGVLWQVNLTTFQASSVKLSSVINVADLTVSPTDGNLYGVADNGKLLRIDPRTGRVAARSVAGLEPGTYGAVWFTAEGDLIVYENGTSLGSGTIIGISRPATAPSVVSQQQGPSTRGNDGAAYVAPPDPAGLSVVVDVLANDGDPDGELDRKSLRIVEPPTNGTALINADNTVTYTSGSSYRGTDSFRYEVCDNGAPAQCGTATVNITSALTTSSTNGAASRKE
jgi:large repetitive protein